MGPIEVFPTFCPRPIEGPISDPRRGKLAIMEFMYNKFYNTAGTGPDPICV